MADVALFRAYREAAFTGEGEAMTLLGEADWRLDVVLGGLRRFNSAFNVARVSSSL